MTSNATLRAWKRDDDTGGAIDGDGHYAEGSPPTFYVSDYPCRVQGFLRAEVRDATDGSVITEPGRISIDRPRDEFEMGDFVSVTYDDGAVVGRIGEVRKIAWNSRGRVATVLWVQWLQKQ